MVPYFLPCLRAYFFNPFCVSLGKFPLDQDRYGKSYKKEEEEEDRYGKSKYRRLEVAYTQA
jgi:hypothetical protein